MRRISITLIQGGDVAESLYAAIASLAKRQHGYVTRAQLLKRGASSSWVTRQTEQGSLIPVYQGIYAVGHVPTSPIDRAAGALLACGPDAVLSHGSAATLWGLEKAWRAPLHVTTPTVRERPGIVTHRARLTRTDRRTQMGLRVTSPARTLLDLAPGLDKRELCRAFNDARHSYLQLDQLLDVLERFPRHPGAMPLTALVNDSTGPTRSELEDAFIELCREYGLPMPLINTRIGGYEVDAYFPDRRVVVELDGWQWHGDRDAFERDRERDAHLLALGIITIRITWERLTRAPAQEAARLLAILERAA